MLLYNIYYKNEPVNNRPVNYNTLQDILAKKFVYKTNKYNNTTLKINTKDLNIVECTVI